MNKRGQILGLGSQEVFTYFKVRFSSVITMNLLRAKLLLFYATSKMLGFLNTNILYGWFLPNFYLFIFMKVFPGHCYFIGRLQNTNFREFEYVPSFKLNNKCYSIFTYANIYLVTKQTLAAIRAVDGTPGMSRVMCGSRADVIEVPLWSSLLKKLSCSGLP